MKLGGKLFQRPTTSTSSRVQDSTRRADETAAPPESGSSDRLLRLPAVLKLTGMAKATIYRLIADRRFPRPIRITGRAVAWRERDVLEWIRARPSTEEVSV